MLIESFQDFFCKILGINFGQKTSIFFSTKRLRLYLKDKQHYPCFLSFFKFQNPSSETLKDTFTPSIFFIYGSNAHLNILPLPQLHFRENFAIRCNYGTNVCIYCIVHRPSCFLLENTGHPTIFRRNARLSKK